MLWRVYPKNAVEREPYIINRYVLSAMLQLLEVHHRYSGIAGKDESGQAHPSGLSTIPALSCRASFSHTRRFPDTYRFLLQWQGKQIPQPALGICLSFLLLEHDYRDDKGAPVRIIPHLLRHASATWLRSQGVPLTEVMKFLKHINMNVSDYYSELSPEQLHDRIGPMLTTLGELAGIDPSTIRTPNDIRRVEEDALKRYGLVQHTAGGMCGTLYPCPVHFQCAGCTQYIPDPARRGEVEEKISTHQAAAAFFEKRGDYLERNRYETALRSWRRVLAEMDGLSDVPLLDSSAAETLQQLVHSSAKYLLDVTPDTSSKPDGDSEAEGPSQTSCAPDSAKN